MFIHVARIREALLIGIQMDWNSDGVFRKFEIIPIV